MTLCRITLAKVIGPVGIEYGCGSGPHLFSVKINGGTLLINLIPMGDYAKFPMKEQNDKSEIESDECIGSRFQMHSMNLIGVIAPAILVLILSIFLSRSVLEDGLAVISEFLSALNIGTGIVSASDVWNGNGLVGLYFTYLSFLLLNCIPFTYSPVGYILGWHSIKKVVPRVAILILTLSTMIIALISILW